MTGSSTRDETVNSLADVPKPTSEADRGRMEAQRQRDTKPEMSIRRWLHRHGYRYRVDVRPVQAIPRRADVVFPGIKLAVFVDGCFWHGCPDHMTWPKANRQWWRAMIRQNQRRDKDTTERLRGAGWAVLRVWEHENPDEAAKQIAAHVDQARVDPLDKSASPSTPDPGSVLA